VGGGFADFEHPLPARAGMVEVKSKKSQWRNKKTSYNFKPSKNYLYQSYCI